MIDPRLRLRRSILIDSPLLTSRILSNNPSLIHNPDSLGNTTLHLACEHGRLSIITYLLTSTRHEVDGPSRNNVGDTPLHTAALAGHSSCVSYLAAAFPTDIDARNRLGVTPLMLACEAGHEVVVRALISAGADVAATDCRGDSALHRGSAYGHLKVLRVLVESGADGDARNWQGWRAREYSWTREAERYFDTLLEERERRGWGERDREMAARVAGGEWRGPAGTPVVMGTGVPAVMGGRQRASSGS